MQSTDPQNFYTEASLTIILRGVSFLYPTPNLQTTYRVVITAQDRTLHEFQHQTMSRWHDTFSINLIDIGTHVIELILFLDEKETGRTKINLAEVYLRFEELKTNKISEKIKILDMTRFKYGFFDMKFIKMSEDVVGGLEVPSVSLKQSMPMKYEKDGQYKHDEQQSFSLFKLFTCCKSNRDQERLTEAQMTVFPMQQNRNPQLLQPNQPIMMPNMNNNMQYSTAIPPTSPHIVQQNISFGMSKKQPQMNMGSNFYTNESNIYNLQSQIGQKVKNSAIDAQFSFIRKKDSNMGMTAPPSTQQVMSQVPYNNLQSMNANTQLMVSKTTRIPLQSGTYTNNIVNSAQYEDAQYASAQTISRSLHQAIKQKLQGSTYPSYSTPGAPVSSVTPAIPVTPVAPVTSVTSTIPVTPTNTNTQIATSQQYYPQQQYTTPGQPVNPNTNMNQYQYEYQQNMPYGSHIANTQPPQQSQLMNFIQRLIFQ